VSNEFSCEVAIQSGGQSTGKTEKGTARIRELSAPERSRRAVKVWAISWGIAVFCVLLPLVHFVLVPGFLLGGPIVAYFLYHQEKLMLGGRGICPACGKEFSFEPGKLKWPYDDICGNCRTQVKLVELSP
jgi:hypothetical protein